IAGDGEATYVKGQNAEIYLNGAKFENTTNVFEINGLTITALDKTEGEGLTLTTEQDTDGIYDMIKNFFKEYNSLINEMDKLYNAEKAKDMEPLTDEEKEDMSDSEIEKWEQKIKDQLLRRDDTLYSVADGLKSIFAQGVKVGDKTMYLSEFGINTLGYFLAGENEKNAYHIDGNEDDESTSGNADKLKSAIANDPDKVINFFTSLFNNMYKKMNDLSSSVEGTRSFGTFYNDKKLKSDYDGYKTKIKDLETALADYEDKWYKKFSKMETAMAKLQSNTSAVTSMLGQ
ncbi:MAG: flagellar filament capping protein FliD, partial [Lachnospiraceae bacterium]|nr:flagellar filament capping protein FliD [Lachnospiraceae bacterium]